MKRSARTVGLLVLLTTVLTAGAPNVLRVRVHLGDTLSELAGRHHTTVARIKALNHLRSDTIYAGAILRLPGNHRAAAPRRPHSRAHSRAHSGVQRRLRIYVVRSGDNLSVIAKRLHTTTRALKARNHLRTTTLQVHQRLRYVATTRPAAHRRARHSHASRGASHSVARSAAHHRASLRRRHLPSKASVQRMIRSSARRHGVSASLVLAVAYQESGFQQGVVSPADAIGVMQVLPSTGRALGRIHGRRFNLFTASDNIEAGVLLIRDLLRATRSAPMALAGYYQGLGSVHSVGLLPQTRAYIRNVQLLRRRFS